MEDGSDLSAAINWGDGTVSAGTLTQSGGVGQPFTVSGSHTYAMEGGYNVHVTVNDIGGVSVGADTQILVVDAPLTPQAVTFSAQPGVAFTTTVGKFLDANPLASENDYIAVIKWGDGTVTDGLVQADSAGGYDVIGTHTYATTGQKSVVVTIHDFATGTVVNSTALVGAPALTAPAAKPAPHIIAAVGQNISSVEGKAFSGTVASFQNTDAATLASNLTAKISWGDGASSAGTIVRDSAGKFHVTGSHTYADPGRYSATVSISAVSGAGASIDFKAAVADAPLIAGSPLRLAAKVNQSFSGIVGSFTDTDARNSTAPHYTATINWGDGTSSAARFVFDASTHKWNVIASHRYSRKGTFAIRINVKDVTATITLLAGMTVS